MSDAGQISAARQRFTIAASTDYRPDDVSRGLYVATAGNLVCQLENESSDGTFTGLLAGNVYPFRVRKITGSGTTITGFLLY